jgi:small subunit ribosomal protein S8
MNYPIGDFLVQIKNAVMAKHKIVETRSSKLIKNVANALKKEGFLDEVKEKDGKLSVRLTIRKKEPLLTNVILISKPGLRIYMSADDLEKIKDPYIYIVSTPKGVMTGKDAIKKRLGGEVIAKVL